MSCNWIDTAYHVPHIGGWKEAGSWRWGTGEMKMYEGLQLSSVEGHDYIYFSLLDQKLINLGDEYRSSLCETSK